MARPLESQLYQELTISEFSFMERGIRHIHINYEVVKKISRNFVTTLIHVPKIVKKDQISRNGITWFEQHFNSLNQIMVISDIQEIGVFGNSDSLER